ALRLMRDAIDKKISPALSAVEELRTIWERRVMEAPATLAPQVQAICDKVHDGWHDIDVIIDDNRHFTDELFPTIAGTDPQLGGFLSSGHQIGCRSKGVVRRAELEHWEMDETSI